MSSSSSFLFTFALLAALILSPIACSAAQYEDEADASTNVEFPILNVKDYGATGDGTTDDTAAILKAASDLSQMAGTLVFPAGQYVLTQPLVLSTPQETTCTVPSWFLSIRGDSVDSSVILWSGVLPQTQGIIVSFINAGNNSYPACSPLQVALSNISLSWEANVTSSLTSIFTFSNISNLVATNVETVMRGPTPPSNFTGPAGFSFETFNTILTANVTFNNIYMYGLYSAALNLGGGLRNVEISGLVVEGAGFSGGYAVFASASFGSYNITISDSNVVNTGLLLTSATTEGYPGYALISNVIVDNSLYGFQGGAIFVGDDGNITVQSTTLIGGGIVGTCSSEYFRCESNIQLNEVQLLNIQGNAINLQSGNLTVTDSLFMNVAQAGIDAYAQAASPYMFVTATNSRWVNTQMSASVTVNYDQGSFIFTGNSCSNSTQAGYCFTSCHISSNSGCSMGP